MESLAPPIFVTLIVCLLLECLALALTSDVAMAAACRVIIFLLLGLAYTIKREINRRLVRRRQRLSTLGLYQYVLLIVSLTTIIFHAFMISFIAARLYSLILGFSSLIIAIDEYQELLWLQEYQSHVKNRSKIRRQQQPTKEDGFVLVQNTTLDEEAIIEEEVMEERVSFYYMLCTMCMCTPKSLLLLQDILTHSSPQESPV